MNIYKKLEEMNLKLVPAPMPFGRYKHSETFMDGRMVYSSGAGCRRNGTPIYTGRVGREVTIEEGQACARQCVMNILNGLHTDLGDLNRIKKVVKVLGFISSAEQFFDQPKVLNGASELLYEIFGDAGVGARSAIGVYALPGNIPVEIEIIFELNDE